MLYYYYSNMYLSKDERKEILSAFGCEDFIENNHYQVEPDTWVYLFCDKNDKKYVLIDTDHIDFDFETYPHLLKFDDSEFAKLKFVLQREISVKNDSLRKKTAGTLLFEYTD